MGKSAGAQMVVLVSTTIIFMATITLQESRPRVNAAKDMLENIARRPLVGLDVPMADSVLIQTYAPVQMAILEPDARQHFAIPAAKMVGAALRLSNANVPRVSLALFAKSIPVNLNVATEVFVLVTISVPALMDSAAQIVKMKHARFTVKTAGFVPCLTTNVNVATDITELDATKKYVNDILQYGNLIAKPINKW